MTNEKWELVKLGDVVNINPENRSPVKENWDEIITYVDIDAVENATGKIVSPKILRFKEAPSRARRVIHKDDVLVSMVRPELKAFAYVPKELDNQICSTGFAVLRGKGLTNPLYLLNVMFSEQVISQFRKLTVGGQYPSLTQKTISQIVIPLPPLPEQQRIASILSAADKAIEEAGIAVEESERIKSGLMQELLPVNDDDAVGWTHKKLSELCDVRDGTHDSPKYQSKGYPLITSKNIVGGDFDLSSVNYISEKDFQKISRRSAVDDGDIIMPMIGTIGFPMIVHKSFEFAIKNVALIKFLENSEVDNQYVCYLLSSEGFMRYIVANNRGCTQKFISLDNIRKFVVSYPQRLEEQKRIVSILGVADEKISLCKKRKALLKKMKQGLMQQLLGGI